MASGKKMPTVAIIGGGFGGICAAIQLEKQLGITSYTIFEENENFGGTWWSNKYPGCACDIQSHLYSLSFELNPDWTQSYSSQPEILEYIFKVAKKYGLYSKAKFNTQVKSLTWKEEGQWEVTVFDKNSKSTQVLDFDFTINAVGPLRVPYIPEEFKKFTGPILHSAEYDPRIDLTGKSVGVVGCGSSAIQIIPVIAPLVKDLHCYQRRPGWVQPRNQFDFPNYVKKLFKIFPLLMLIYRAYIFLFGELFFSVFKANSTLNSLGTKQAIGHLKKEIPGDENLQKKLMPNFKLGCKRILFSETYYKMFNRPNVHLYREKIDKIQGTCIATEDGVAQKLDVLILATGFRVQEFFFPLKIKARNGIDLLSHWRAESPQTYYGIMSNATPNSFILLGPNTALGHSSVIFMIECQVNFVIQVIKETMDRGAKTVSVKKEAEEKWMSETQENLKSTVWGTETCGSWYTDAKGRITALWPKNCIAYYWETKRVDFDKMEFTFEQ